ncbi:MAG: fimbrillin family protein [Mucinivorans sp.]
MKHSVIGIVAATVAISLGVTMQSCKKNLSSGHNGAKIEVSVAIDGVAQAAAQSKALSRATPTGVSKTAFVQGDNFGMWVVPYSNSTSGAEQATDLRPSGNYVDNAKYVLGATDFTTTDEVYYPNAETLVDLYAVSPYGATNLGGTTDPRAFPFSITADQSTTAGVNVIVNDLMTAKTEKVKQGVTGTPKLAFTHRMSRIWVTFTMPTQYKGTNITSVDKVEICGVQLKSKVNLVDQTATPTIDAIAGNPKVDITAYQASAPTSPTVAGDYYYEAIVMPGTVIANGASLVRVTITVGSAPSSTVVFDCKTSAQYTFVAAQQTSVTVTIEDQEAITLPAGNVTINAWGTATAPDASTVKPAKMIFATTGATAATQCAKIKYADLTIDGTVYRADVTYDGVGNKLNCIYRMPAERFPNILTVVKFLELNETSEITPTSFNPLLNTNPIIVGNPFEINTYTNVISTVTFN